MPMRSVCSSFSKACLAAVLTATMSSCGSTSEASDQSEPTQLEMFNEASVNFDADIERLLPIIESSLRADSSESNQLLLDADEATGEYRTFVESLDLPPSADDEVGATVGKLNAYSIVFVNVKAAFIPDLSNPSSGPDGANSLSLLGLLEEKEVQAELDEAESDLRSIIEANE